MSLALIVALPFLGALLPALIIRTGRNNCAFVSAAFCALALIGLYTHLPDVLAGNPVHFRLNWLDHLGMNVNFFLDGLGFFFAGLILGIGLLIILYARFYLDRTDPMGVFYTYLMLFQGAMLGIVLSDNILLLLIFWELTSLSSFLLIGYWHHLPAGRQGARMALCVTGAGGLALIAGMLLLGHSAQSYDLSVILDRRDIIQAGPLYLPALALILLGCLTKSAQFPFHFWLPHAMAAPTPVSAYLHSATMVKAGIFLLARLWPVLSGTEAWFWTLAPIGLITMLVGAKIALFKDDLKAILAFSTVSHLGLITMLLGFGTQGAVIAAMFHILNHAIFKAALFMCAGIIDHSVHTRDLKRLGGLLYVMPITFTISIITALSMAGFPPLNGFLSKEMMLEATLHTPSWLFPVLATGAAALSVGYSLRLISHCFLGPQRDDYPHVPHDPVTSLWLAPALLAVLAVLIGLMPQTLAGWIVDLAAGAVTGASIHSHIALWHGPESGALWMSLVAIGGGIMVLGLYPLLAQIYAGPPLPDAKRLFDALIGALTASCRCISAAVHNGSLGFYLALSITAMAAAGLYAFASAPYKAGQIALTSITPTALICWALLVSATIAGVIIHHQRLITLIFVAIIGLIVSAGFAYLSAPDLALTQISVEVVTVVLMLLALNFLPKTTPKESPMPRKIRDGLVALITGGAVGGLIYALMTRDFAFPTIAQYHLANSKIMGGGENVVNVILVDFRGYDTFGEITVLGIAATVIFALTETILRRGPANDRLRAWQETTPDAGDRHPMIMVIATRLILPIALMIGIYIFLRGHNLPGGGFIAGLVVAIALIMQYMASGFAWTAARQKIDYHALIGTGILVAAFTGVGSWLFQRPFMTSTFGHIHIWPFEEFELASAALFDLGVFLTVLGAVMLALSSLTRMSIRAGQVVNDDAYDMEPKNSGKGL